MGYLVRAYEGFVGLVNTDMYLWSLNIFLQINVRTRKLEYKNPGALEFYIWVLMRRNDFFLYKNVVQTCPLHKQSWDKLYLCSSIITDPGFITICWVGL